MSTRSNIAIKLRKGDNDKQFKTVWGEDIYNTPETQYLYVYCHFDGYPEGVGVNLVKKFRNKTYEDALKYILEGDRSTSYLSYYEKRGDECGPYPAENIGDMFENEYLYVIEEIDGKLHVNVHYTDGEIADLTEELRYQGYIGEEPINEIEEREDYKSNKESIYKAERILIDNGIDEIKASTVLQAIGYVLLNKELYPED